MKYRDTIIFDVETTGLLEPEASLLVNQPHITEIYIVRVDKKFRVVYELSTFVYSPVPIPKHIEKITNISDTMLLGAPPFVQVYKDLVEIFMGVRTMVAHNLPFDSGMLWVELSRIGMEFHFPWPPEWYCTIEHSMHIKGKRMKLTDLHELATGKPHKDGAHRAKQDVQALLRCYQWMKKEGM